MSSLKKQEFKLSPDGLTWYGGTCAMCNDNKLPTCSPNNCSNNQRKPIDVYRYKNLFLCRRHKAQHEEAEYIGEFKGE
jgi:hypothetical protein